MRLRDRIAIITGGGQGIGRATCLLLAKEGANIVIAEHNSTTAEAVGKEVETLGGGVLSSKPMSQTVLLYAPW